MSYRFLAISIATLASAGCGGSTPASTPPSSTTDRDAAAANVPVPNDNVTTPEAPADAGTADAGTVVTGSSCGAGIRAFIVDTNGNDWRPGSKDVEIPEAIDGKRDRGWKTNKPGKVLLTSETPTKMIGLTMHLDAPSNGAVLSFVVIGEHEDKVRKVMLGEVTRGPITDRRELRFKDIEKWSKRNLRVQLTTDENITVDFEPICAK